MKLFGIGTNKTGTVSMRYAFETAGLRVLHDYGAGRLIVEDLQAGRRPAALDQYDVFLDGPYEDAAELLLDQVPDSRLLYHWRPLNDFICSSMMHVLDNRLNKPGDPWRNLNTDHLERHWNKINRIARAVRSAVPDRIAEYQLGDNWSWRNALQALGLDQVGDLPFYHRSMDRVAAIEAHYQQRKTIAETPVVLAVRSSNNWAAGENRLPEFANTPDFEERVSKWWPQVFEMPYTEYRGRLTAIARANWSRLQGIDSQICARTWEIERFSNAIIIPIDDDDWLDPETVSIVRQNLDDSTHAVCWQVDRVETVGSGNYKSWLNGDRDRFATNGYALAPIYRDLCQGRDYREAVLFHIRAARKEATVSELDQVLGIAPRTFASVSFLRKVETLADLVALAWKAKADHKPENSLFPEKPFGLEFCSLWSANDELFRSLKV